MEIPVWVEHPQSLAEALRLVRRRKVIGTLICHKRGHSRLGDPPTHVIGVTVLVQIEGISQDFWV